MGFKSVFKRKKKRSPTVETKSTAIIPKSPSLNGRNRLEEELALVFEKFDANGDGRICAAELGSIMRSLGHEATAEEVRMMIAEVDGDGDGFIDLEEFVELNTKGVDHDEALENLKHAFEVFDVDKNGTISAEELHNVLKSLGEECTFDECRKMIAGVDSDAKGCINFDEFKVMMIRGSRFET